VQINMMNLKAIRVDVIAPRFGLMLSIWREFFDAGMKKRVSSRRKLHK